jgi:hypothetical protein
VHWCFYLSTTSNAHWWFYLSTTSDVHWYFFSLPVVLLLPIPSEKFWSFITTHWHDIKAQMMAYCRADGVAQEAKCKLVEPDELCVMQILTSLIVVLLQPTSPTKTVTVTIPTTPSHMPCPCFGR